MTILQIQALLTYLGYDPGTVDGLNGRNTQAAVRTFQQAEGLAADGIPGPKTEAALLDAVNHGRFCGMTPMPSTPAESGTTETGTFWDEIEFFSREEFRCKCGWKYCNGFPAEPDEMAVRCADEIRREAGVPLRVNSGLRCDTWNRLQGGAIGSYHRTGQAIDLSGNISPSKLLQIAQSVQEKIIPGRGGLGLYSWGIHEDSGPKRRWNG